MKKILAIFLALVMILSVALVACSKDKATTSGDGDGGDDDDVFMAQNSKDTTDTGDDDKKDKVGYDAVNYTVYVMGKDVRVRSEDSTGDNVLGYANIGDSFVATATDGDWYKIAYNNSDAYISADYVTTNQNESVFEGCDPTPLKIKNTVVNENATTDTEKYAKVQLRSDPALTEATKKDQPVLIYTNTQNDELVKVGQNKSGTWYKVTYNGNTYYVGSGAFKHFEGYTGGSTGGLG